MSTQKKSFLPRTPLSTSHSTLLPTDIKKKKERKNENQFEKKRKEKKRKK